MGGFLSVIDREMSHHDLLSNILWLSAEENCLVFSSPLQHTDGLYLRLSSRIPTCHHYVDCTRKPRQNSEKVCQATKLAVRDGSQDNSMHRANPATIQDKFMVGYQGWFVI